MGNFTLVEPEDQVYVRITEIVITFILPIFLTCGSVGNIINTIVFFRLGLKDSVTISLFILALSDLSFLLLSSVTTMFLSMYLNGFEVTLETSYLKVGISANEYEFIFSDFSMLITTYVAVTKCCCVAMPLKFKGVFTLYRTNIILTVMFVTNLALKLPMIASIGLMWKTDPWSAEVQGAHHAMKNFPYIVNRNCLPYVTACITIVCMVVLIYKLQAASSDRNKMMADAKARSILLSPSVSFCPKKARKISTRGLGRSTCGGNNNRVDSGRGISPSSNFSKRDQQVAKAVILVSAAFVIDTLYYASVALAKLVDRDYLDLLSLYNVLSLSFYMVKHIDAGINLAIYFNFNSKYRHIIQGWFQICCHGAACKNQQS